LRGIGLTFATVLDNEVLFRAFRNRRAVGGYRADAAGVRGTNASGDGAVREAGGAVI